MDRPTGRPTDRPTVRLTQDRQGQDRYGDGDLLSVSARCLSVSVCLARPMAKVSTCKYSVLPTCRVPPTRTIVLCSAQPNLLYTWPRVSETALTCPLYSTLGRHLPTYCTYLDSSRYYSTVCIRENLARLKKKQAGQARNKPMPIPCQWWMVK